MHSGFAGRTSRSGRRWAFDGNEEDRPGFLSRCKRRESRQGRPRTRTVLFPLPGSVSASPDGAFGCVRTHRPVCLHKGLSGASFPNAADPSGTNRRPRAVASARKRDLHSGGGNPMQRRAGLGRYAGRPGTRPQHPFERSQTVRPSAAAIAALRESLPVSSRNHLEKAISKIVEAKQRGGRVIVVTGSGPNLHEGVTTQIAELIQHGLVDGVLTSSAVVAHEMGGTLDRVKRIRIEPDADSEITIGL